MRIVLEVNALRTTYHALAAWRRGKDVCLRIQNYRLLCLAWRGSSPLTRNRSLLLNPERYDAPYDGELTLNLYP